MYGPTFYVTSLGQTELQGPMIINVTLLTAPGNWTEAKPRLVYWNSGKVKSSTPFVYSQVQTKHSQPESAFKRWLL